MRKLDAEWVRVMVMDWVAMSVATVLVGALTYAVVSDAALSVGENGLQGATASMAVLEQAKPELVERIEDQDRFVSVLE